MCGRVTLTTSAERLAEEYALSAWPPRDPRYNLAPTQLIELLRPKPSADSNPDISLEVATVRWGFIPEWSQPPYHPIINARSETLASKPAFRKAFKLRRALIPVDGFFEWEKIGRVRQPFLFRMKSRKPFVLGALWERNESDPNPESPQETCVILTTRANALVAPLHDRMPVIIPRDRVTQWLDIRADEPEKLCALMEPFPADAMESVPVDRCVNDVKNNIPECLKPVTLAPRIIQGELDFG